MPPPCPLHTGDSTIFRHDFTQVRFFVTVTPLRTGVQAPGPGRAPRGPNRRTSGSPPDSKHLELAQPTAPLAWARPVSITDTRPPPRRRRRDRIMAGLAPSGCPGQGLSQSAPVSHSGPPHAACETRIRSHSRPARLGPGSTRTRMERPILSGKTASATGRAWQELDCEEKEGGGWLLGGVQPNGQVAQSESPRRPSCLHHL